MATVTNIVLMILIVRGAIVLSQLNDETSPGNAEQQLALIYERQGQLLEKMKEQDADVKQLQADVIGLQTEFACHFSTCESCMYVYYANVRVLRVLRVCTCTTRIVYVCVLRVGLGLSLKIVESAAIQMLCNLKAARRHISSTA